MAEFFRLTTATPGLFQLLGFPRVGPCVILGVLLTNEDSLPFGVFVATFWEVVEQFKLKNTKRQTEYKKL